MNKVKIGQIGICHEHADGKIQTLRRLSEVFEIVGVVDDRATASPRFAGDNLEPFEGLRWMTEDELLGYPGLQAVVVETPNDDLVPTALRCMQHNLPMHLDKPGGRDLALFRQLLDGCQKRELPLQMGYMFRTNRAMLFCQRAVHEGWLGGIFEIQAGMSHNYGGEAYQEYLAHFPGGIMFNLGCHLIDFIVAIMGRPENVTPFLKAAPGSPTTAMNNCVSILEYENSIVTLRACSLEVDGLNRRSLKICGTRGTIELSPLERFDGQPLLLRLTLLDSQEGFSAGVHTVDFGITEDRYEGQLRQLAQVVRGEIPNPWPYDHDYLVQEAVLAASGCIAWEG